LTASTTAQTDITNHPPISYRDAFWTWCRIATLSFGGPAGQIAVMHRIIVEEKQWINEARFLHALNYCMLLPGPEAQQMAIYIGWLIHRTRGGLMAGILFVIPGFVSILALSIIYVSFGDTPVVNGLFFGLKSAVIAIVFFAFMRIGKRVLKNRMMVFVAITSFIAIHFFNASFPALILCAGLIGFIGGKLSPGQFDVNEGHGKEANGNLPFDNSVDTSVQRSTWKYSLRVVAICLPLWFGPTLIAGFVFGRDSAYCQMGILFSQAAVVTFGGAYSVLAYVAQQAVEEFGWLKPGEMLDGLGMAETTPGPLIMVLQFVGFMGAYRNPGSLDPLLAGLIGSCLTTWVTFVPCFLWIFLGAPYIERLQGNRLLRCAMSTITAAVVGVILNLAVWFAMHTLFGTVNSHVRGILTLQVPDVTTIRIPAAAITVIACLLTFYWKQGMVLTIAVSALLGLAYNLMAL